MTVDACNRLLADAGIPYVQAQTWGESVALVAQRPGQTSIHLFSEDAVLEVVSRFIDIVKHGVRKDRKYGIIPVP